MIVGIRRILATHATLEKNKSRLEPKPGSADAQAVDYGVAIALPVRVV